MTDAWRKVPQRERPYDAYRRARYVVDGCDHNGVLCKCDPPFWLRPSTPAEAAHEPLELIESDTVVHP